MKLRKESGLKKTGEQKEEKINWRRRGIAVFFILLFFIFTLTQLDLYKDEILPVDGDSMGEMAEELELYDGIKIEQEMQVKEAEDNYVDINIRNSALRANEGILVFTLYDDEGQLVYKNRLKARRLKAKQKFRLQILENLEPGETYRLILQTSNMSKQRALVLTTTKEQSSYMGSLIVNGEEQGQVRLQSRLVHPSWNIKKIAVIMLAFLFAFAAVFVPVNLPERLNKLFTRILFVITPVACFAIVEKTCKYRIFNMKQPALNLNLWIYAMILILVYLITNRARLAATITVCFSYGMALINYFVSYFRGTVFVPADITAAGTAANVIQSYSFQITTSVLWGGIALMLFLTCFYKIKAYQGMQVTGRLLTLGAYAITAVAFFNIFYQTNSLEEWKVHYKVWNPTISYEKNGFAVCFVVGSKYLIPETPKGYSAKEAQEEAQPYIDKAKNQQSTEGVKPNIIGIMNEAFSDLAVDGDLKVSEDYMPYIHSLTENTVKGNLHVTSFGGRTANTEYEFLTGMSMAFFSGGTVPYEHQMKHSMDSLTTQVRDLGYQGLIALHPYKSNGYNRENAYPALGFETYYSQDIFENPDRVRSYISDKADFEKITELYEEAKKESDAPFYMFNVTMQNHGGYGEDFSNLPLDITIEDKNKNESAERYLNLVKKSDEAFEELTEYYSNVDDPTIIVMFGDHQPNLSDEFFSSLIGSDTVNTLEGVAKEHTVPFVIWANYDIQEEEVEQMSVNYLSTKVAEVAGISLTPFQCFLQEMQEEIPVITGNYYIGKDGEIRELANTKGYEEWINTYHMFQYNQVYDYKNVLKNFFSVVSS
ncbi:MAG: LTA synthase family protein [Lachnospiraceae bacterium]|nr:LTA synthase family protein [Lachnospiraceae bacterium]